MSKRIGANTNVNDESIVKDGITLNSTTSIKISDANDKRIHFTVNNNSSTKAGWIKLQPATEDNKMKGIFLERRGFGDSRWSMPEKALYTGEISAISESGNPVIYVTEY